MTKKFLFITIVLTVFGMIFEWFLGWPLGVLGSIFDIFMIALIVTLVGRAFSRGKVEFVPFLLRNMLVCGSIIGWATVFLLSFAFYSNTFPGSLSEIHMSNGKRNIVFMQMSHIGSKSYYAQVHSRLTELTASWYYLYREGVLPGTPESQKRFDQTLGIKLSTGTYSDVAQVIGLVAQDSTLFDGISPSSMTGVDLNLDQIVALMGSGKQASLDPPLDPSLEVGALANMNTGPLLPYIFRWFLNFTLSSLSSTDFFLDTLDPGIRQAIIEKRNQYVVDTFLSDKNQNVVIVYGALHFEGIYAILRSKDPLWNIVTIKPYYPYKN